MGPDLTALTQQKADARKLAFERRKTAHSIQSSQLACERLLRFLRPSAGKVVSAYMPIRTEIDVMPAMLRLAEETTLCVPVIRGAGMALDFHKWTPGCDMVDGPFGARVPADAVPMRPEIVILPLVAFDRRGYRLGYGGGFYDRSLESLKKSGPILSVGFAYSAQETDTVPIEPTDQRLDAMVTERETIVF